MLPWLCRSRSSWRTIWMMRARALGSPLITTELVRSSATTLGESSREALAPWLLPSLLRLVTSRTISPAEAYFSLMTSISWSPALSTRRTTSTRRLTTAARPVMSSTLDGS
ncbi:hypothetical protein D3C84_606720 [compost metagenome]